MNSTRELNKGKVKLGSTSPFEIDRTRQTDLFGEKIQPRKAAAVKRPFVRRDPNELLIGMTPLREHLIESGVQEPFVIRDLLLKQDWSAFEASYGPVGRAPYAPEAMMGLVLYGVMQGTHSLRGLMKLARVDLGCMWVTGGICPDHANIARFINRHSELIEGPFFEGLTRSVLHSSGSNISSVAGDGTVIEAACAKFGLLKSESLKELAEKVREDSDDDPDDPGLRKRLQQVEAAEEQLSKRQQRRTDAGKPLGNEQVSLQEPEAAVQRCKRGRGYAPSYKPSVLSNDQRIIVGYDVDPSSETSVVEHLLDQAQSIGQTAVEELMLDAGYFNNQVIDLSLERDISLLCPEGKGTEPKVSDKIYLKGCFAYDPLDDIYRCPEGQELRLDHIYNGSEQYHGYRAYSSPACATCPKLARCTRRKGGRIIKRYAGDEKKDALRFVMTQPRAKARYRKRNAYVEPVFASLRGSQGLNRFRRKGLAKVRLEFALHALAHNVRRAVAIRRLLAFFRGLKPRFTSVERLFERLFINNHQPPTFSLNVG